MLKVNAAAQRWLLYLLGVFASVRYGTRHSRTFARYGRVKEGGICSLESPHRASFAVCCRKRRVSACRLEKIGFKQ
jgi:hypothetical protein